MWHLADHEGYHLSEMVIQLQLYSDSNLKCVHMKVIYVCSYCFSLAAGYTVSKVYCHVYTDQWKMQCTLIETKSLPHLDMKQGEVNN